MNCTKSVRVSALAAVALAFTTVNAKADFITGYGWITTGAIAMSATGATAASLALSTCHSGAGACTLANADVSFTTTGVNFSATNATIAQWLNSNTFALNNLVDNVGGTQVSPSIWELFGNITVTSLEAFSVTHDDGTTFVVNGQTVVNAPGPSSPSTLTPAYTGPASGSAPFNLIYTECCGGPAVLQVGPLAPPAVPEPGSIVLLGTVICGIVVIRRRRNAKSSPR
jgi:hypothetical protein